MKAAFLLIAVAALSSCACKPWMVGSVNDQYDAPELEGSVNDLATPEGYAQGSGGSGSGGASYSGKSPRSAPVAPGRKHYHSKHKANDEILNPVNHTGSNPSR